GPALNAILEGVPAGLQVTPEGINLQLKRRQKGYGRGGRMKIEQDQVKILAGVRDGVTLGSPIALMIENNDWQNWQEIMYPLPGARLSERRVTAPRPGHADLTGAIKYRHEDIRNILERASARETAMRVAVGTIARELLAGAGVNVRSHVLNIGGESVSECQEFDNGFWERVEESAVSCGEPGATDRMIKAIDRAKEQGESLGGVFELVVTGLPPGLGSHVQWDRKLDGRLAQAIVSIQAVKGVEFGLGFAAGRVCGSQAHDEIFYSPMEGYYHRTNRAGGIEGGMSNGEPVIIRAVMKPIPTLYSPLNSVDMLTKESVKASVERSDTCAVPAAAVVAEAAVAWELACALVEKFPADHVIDLRQSITNYLEYVKTR
ncbi:MAG TPA: chorismate synthase, partial [Verrucomicrobiae bacterium]|nr:chorismate synthase [Verrucomicrobiae bacterium]